MIHKTKVFKMLKDDRMTDTEDFNVKIAFCTWAPAEIFPEEGGKTTNT